MNALNKRQMMLAISVSVTAYAFAMTGCGQKDAPNKASKADNIAAVQSMAGTWVSDEQAVKAGQKNLNFVTITKTSMKLRALCAIDAKDDKTPAINAVAEVSNDFSVEAKTKNIKFKTAKAFKADASSDCAVSLKDGNIQYSLEGDKLTLGVTADGTATDSKKAIKDVGMVFKKVTDDEAKTRESDFKSKSAAGIAAAVAKQDPNAPKDGTVVDKATKDAIAKADATNIAQLNGYWLLQSDDLKVKNDKDLSKLLTKSNVDLIEFSDAPVRFNERIACSYVAASDKNSQNVLELGFKLNIIEKDATQDPFDAMAQQLKTSGLSFESVLNESSIKITQPNGGTNSVPWKTEFMNLTTAQQELATCQLTYVAGQKIGFDISGDGKTLALKDDKNGTRIFKKISKLTVAESQKSALALLARAAGDATTSDKAKTPDDETPDAAPSAPAAQAPAAPVAPAAQAPAATSTTTTTPPASKDAAKPAAATSTTAPTTPSTAVPTATTTSSTTSPTAKEAAAKMVAMAAAAGQKKDTTPEATTRTITTTPASSSTGVVGTDPHTRQL